MNITTITLTVLNDWSEDAIDRLREYRIKYETTEHGDIQIHIRDLDSARDALGDLLTNQPSADSRIVHRPSRPGAFPWSLMVRPDGWVECMDVHGETHGIIPDLRTARAVVDRYERHMGRVSFQNCFNHVSNPSK